MASPAMVGSCFAGLSVGFICVAEVVKRNMIRARGSSAKPDKCKKSNTRRKDVRRKHINNEGSSSSDSEIAMDSSTQRNPFHAKRTVGRGRMDRRGSRTLDNPNDSRKNRDSVVPCEDDTVMDGGWEGFSMEEALQHAEISSEVIKQTTPEEVLAQLQRGNTRFWMGAWKKPALSAFHRRALLTKQFPSVAVLSCSDSRVPVEILFNMSLGDMFVTRVAGNALNNSTLASLQYAVHHLKVKLLLIMGHEGCGAVKAAALPESDIEKEPPALQTLLGSLGEGMDFARLRNCRDKRAHDRESVVSNVTNQLKIISCDEGIMKKVHSQELKVIGGFYELSSGIVDFFSVAETLASRGVVGHVDHSPKRSSRKRTATLLPTLNLQGKNESDEDA